MLLQVVFHAQMEKEKGVFDMDDVADGICKKLIFRHPHIFGDVKVGSTDEILPTGTTSSARKKAGDRHLDARKCLQEPAEPHPCAEAPEKGREGRL